MLRYYSLVLAIITNVEVPELVYRLKLHGDEVGFKPSMCDAV